MTNADVRALLDSRTTCPLCKKRMTTAPGRRQKHLDHIVPLNIGGTHTHGNVRVICRTCNLSRPSDGSDLAGHATTLWATDALAAEAAAVLRAARPKPPPKLPPPPDPWKQGAALADRIKRDLALLLRHNGMGWQDIANRVGYASAGAAHNGASLGGKRRITTCNL